MMSQQPQMEPKEGEEWFAVSQPTQESNVDLLGTGLSRDLGMESEVEPVCTQTEEEAKFKRLKLKDELYAMLKA